MATHASAPGPAGRRTFKLVLPASGSRGYNLVAHDGKYLEWRTWANGVLPVIHTQPGDTLRDVEIRLSRPATVRGRVTDAAGRPVAKREVRASAADLLENRYYDPTVKTAKDGTYELRFIRPGEQFIQVTPFWLDPRQAPEGTSRTLALTTGESRDGIDFPASGPRRRGLKVFRRSEEDSKSPGMPGVPAGGGLLLRRAYRPATWTGAL